MYRNVMVPVDGSPFAEHALPYAAALASAAGAQLRLVMVHVPHPPRAIYITPSRELIDTQQREEEQEYLAALTRHVGTQWEVHAETSLLAGIAAGALARFASGRDVELIVMSTHGRGGLRRMWLGSVADALVRRARVPTLLVRPAVGTAPRRWIEIRRVLVAVDGSASAEAALTEASNLCATLHASCTIVRIVVPPTHVISSSLPDTAKMTHAKTRARSEEAEQYLRELVARATLPKNTRVETIPALHPAPAIIRFAESERADVIVVGTRGHGGAARLILGSVADQVIRGSAIPVLVCPLRAVRERTDAATLGHTALQQA